MRDGDHGAAQAVERLGAAELAGRHELARGCAVRAPVLEDASLRDRSRDAHADSAGLCLRETPDVDADRSGPVRRVGCVGAPLAHEATYAPRRDVGAPGFEESWIPGKCLGEGAEICYARARAGRGR